MAALVWLVVGVLLIAAEVLSGDFVLLMLGVAGLAAAGTATVAGVPASAIVFVIASTALIALARPAFKRHMMRGIPHHRTNVEGLIGNRATVVQRVDAHGGQVKIGGDLWSARAFDDSQVLEPGRTVTVMEISGATAIVWDGP